MTPEQREARAALMRNARSVNQRDRENDMARMTGDPYLQNGSNVIGISDAGQFAETERQAIAPRVEVLELLHPNFTAPAFLALHHAIFKPVYTLAGHIRTVPLALDGAEFAHPHFIMPSLVARFDKLNRAGGFADLPHDAFCDSLAHHISELHAIMPFRAGNRRAFAVHSAQLARAAGHSLEACIKDKVIWDDALTHSFITCDHSRISDALLGTAQLQMVSSPSGLPLLPLRDATVHRRYSITLAKAGGLLKHHMAEAMAEAAEALTQLTQANAPQTQINAAHQELGFLRHPKGPLFQLGVLQALGGGKLLAVIYDSQSPLETVREIAVAMLIALREYSPAAITQASAALDCPAYPIGGSPHQERLAAEFLANNPQDNLADPRFASAQRLVDKAVSAASRSSGGNVKQINAAAEKARATIAARIRKGDMFDNEQPTALTVPRHTHVA
jgi:cell filamentation protein